MVTMSRKRFGHVRATRVVGIAPVAPPDLPPTPPPAGAAAPGPVEGRDALA